jgi:hypothetical protein
MTRKTKRTLRPMIEGLESRQLLANCYLVNLASGKVLDDPSGSTASGTLIQQYQLNGGLNQQWQPIYQSDGNYVIMNAASGKVLDDPGGSTADGTPVQQYQFNGGLNQQWYFVTLSDGNSQIVNAASGKVLDDPSGSTANGTIIQQFTANGGVNQEWALLGAGSTAAVGPVNVANAASGKVLDIPSGTTASGTLLQQFQLNGGSNQQLMFVPLSDGYEVIVNTASGLVLDDPSGSTASGTLIQQYPLHGGFNQQWQRHYLSDGNCEIVNLASGLVLDDPSGSTADGTKIQQFAVNGGLNQQWELFSPSLFSLAPQYSGNQFLGDALTVNGNQGVVSENCTISVGVAATGGVMVTVEGQMVAFDSGAITGVTVLPSAGTDTINVEATLAGVPVTISDVYLSFDTINICPTARFLDHIQGNVTVNGTSRDTLTVFDQTDTYVDTYTLTSSTVTRSFSAPMTYHGVASVTLDAGSSNNPSSPQVILAQSTAAGCATTINAAVGYHNIGVGAVGNSTNSLSALRGPLTVNGQSYQDVMSIYDTTSTAGRTYSFAAASASGWNTIKATADASGIVPATITYGPSLGEVALFGTQYDDTCNVASLPYGTPMVLNMMGGHNTARSSLPGASTWLIYPQAPGGGPSSVALDNQVSFVQVWNVQGGPGSDRFLFMPKYGANGGLGGNMNGGGGGDTLDYSQYTHGVNVNLGAYGNGTYGYAAGVGGTVSNIQNVIGSPYADVLTGNRFGNVLVGGGGGDVINGGTGPSVLIGGRGNGTTIHGHSGNDLIIAGYTSFDNNPAALDALFAEWDSTDSITQRMQYLSGPIGHHNGSYFLIHSGIGQTVFTAGYSDTITDVAGTNWVIS